MWIVVVFQSLLHNPSFEISRTEYLTSHREGGAYGFSFGPEGVNKLYLVFILQKQYVL